MADPSPEMLRHGSLRRLRRAPLRLGGRALPVVSPARVYVCGITPYDVTHLGHAATFVWADAVVRTLRAAGGEVVSCRNITDVDDVLSAVATERGRFYDELAATQEFLFDRSMRELRVAAPTHAPRAGAHVESVVELAEALVVLGAAYERDGSVYLRGSEVPARAGLDREAAVASLAAYGDRPDDPHRDDPLDVAVWQSSGEGDPAWPSPWGPGRPGWHAECAAMAVSLLGGQVDVLAGGADLTFPHHAYQSAMVEALTGAAPFARSRMPVGTVCIGGRKMAKSTGNLVLVSDVLEKVAPAVLRLLLLDRPWRQTWDYDESLLAAAGQRLERLYAAAGRPGDDAATTGVLARLLDDLDVPGALDQAEEDGGPAARFALRTLALD
ncbi:MAG TPA: cysteine--tRNA ligase [Actinomycetes bacterium]|nr:cysteine--tRNA ligase [Actinomycetes bacterium]